MQYCHLFGRQPLGGAVYGKATRPGPDPYRPGGPAPKKALHLTVAGRGWLLPSLSRFGESHQNRPVRAAAMPH